MKKLLLLLPIFFTSFLFSQEDWEIEMDEEFCKQHFDEGTQLYEVSQYVLDFDYQLKSLDTSMLKDQIKYEILEEQKVEILTRSLNEFEWILDDFPNCSVINQTLYNKAQIHHELNQIDSARIYYLKLVNKVIKSELDTSQISNLGDERYLNFKNSAYKRLAELEHDEGNYNQSNKHLQNSQQVGYNHFCGNEHAANSKYLAMSYAQNYYELDSLDKSINILIPHILKNSLVKNHDVISLALQYMQEGYSKKELILNYENGFSDFYKRKRNNSDRVDYYFRFLGEEVRINLYRVENLEKEQEKVEESLKSELFYLLLKE